MKLGSAKFPLFFLFLATTFSFVVAVFTAHAAPFWLRGGVYVYYRFGAWRILLQNDTIISDANGVWGWRCNRIEGNTATLEVTLNASGLELVGVMKYEQWKFEDTYEVNVNVETREAYMNDEFIGILPYWMPTNVQEGGSIANFSSYANLTLSVSLVASVGFDVRTPYRNFTRDEMWFLLSETFSYSPSSQIQQAFYYEKESGILIRGEFVDAILHKASIKSIISPDPSSNEGGGWAFELSQTNIEFTQPPSSPLSLIWPYLLIAISAIAITTILAYLLIIVRRKPKPVNREAHSPPLPRVLLRLSARWPFQVSRKA